MATLSTLTMLAQEGWAGAFFNLRNLIFLVLIAGLIIFWKVYKSRQM